MANPVALLILACLISGVTGHTTMCRSCLHSVRDPAECTQFSHCHETCITEVHHRMSGEYVYKYRCGNSNECKEFEQGHAHGRIVCRECCSHTRCDKRTCSNHSSTTVNKSTTHIPATTTATTKTASTTTTTTTAKAPTTIKVPTTRAQTTTLDASATTKPHYFKTSAYAPSTPAPSSTTTKTTMTTTTLASAKHYTSAIVAKRCDSLGVLSDVVKGSSASNPGTIICPDGTHQPSEAVVQKYCGAPNVTSWTSGRKIMGNCQSVPNYTPIAASTASFGGSVVAGVFVRCEVDGFQAAIQTCGSRLKLYYVSASSSPDVPSADKFVLLDW